MEKRFNTFFSKIQYKVTKRKKYIPYINFCISFILVFGTLFVVIVPTSLQFQEPSISLVITGVMFFSILCLLCLLYLRNRTELNLKERIYYDLYTALFNLEKFENERIDIKYRQKALSSLNDIKKNIESYGNMDDTGFTHHIKIIESVNMLYKNISLYQKELSSNKNNELDHYVSLFKILLENLYNNDTDALYNTLKIDNKKIESKPNFLIKNILQYGDYVVATIFSILFCIVLIYTFNSTIPSDIVSRFLGLTLFIGLVGYTRKWIHNPFEKFIRNTLSS